MKTNARKISCLFLFLYFLTFPFVTGQVVVDSVMGVPWGASQAQIKKEMKSKGFSYDHSYTKTIKDNIGAEFEMNLSTGVVFKGTFTEKRVNVTFILFHDSLYAVSIIYPNSYMLYPPNRGHREKLTSSHEIDLESTFGLWDALVSEKYGEGYLRGDATTDMARVKVKTWIMKDSKSLNIRVDLDLNIHRGGKRPEGDCALVYTNQSLADNFFIQMKKEYENSFSLP
jgi:hypothetical protein